MVQYYEIMVFSLGLSLDQTMNYQALAWAQLGPNLVHPQCVCVGGETTPCFGCMFLLSHSWWDLPAIGPTSL